MHFYAGNTHSQYISTPKCSTRFRPMSPDLSVNTPFRLGEVLNQQEAAR